MQLLLLISLVSATSGALALDSRSQLFRRLPKLSDVTFADVGSSEWKKGFPADIPDADNMPEAWISALDSAVHDGRIPDIPKTTQSNGASPKYPNGKDPKSKDICSSSYQCRTSDSIWDGPSGYFGLSFDDGPLKYSDALLDFLKKKGEKATHFMIGKHILANPNQFKKAFDQGHDIAVHSWSNRYMTTLSNKDVVAELGWTMQLIHNSTGGLVPHFWRPPYGDSDARVQAIAKEVFGLKTVIYNKDVDDWGIAKGTKNKIDVSKTFSNYLKSSKDKGLIVLEHESSQPAVDLFINSFDSIKSRGWKTKSLAQLVDDKKPYQNLDGKDLKHDDMFLGNHDSSNGDSPSPSSTADDPEATDDPSSTDSADSPDSTDSADSTDDPTSTDESAPESTSDKKGKDNGAIRDIAGVMSGTLLIALCIAPAAILVIG